MKSLRLNLRLPWAASAEAGGVPRCPCDSMLASVGGVLACACQRPPAVSADSRREEEPLPKLPLLPLLPGVAAELGSRPTESEPRSALLRLERRLGVLRAPDGVSALLPPGDDTLSP